jgi:hypothetical protein
MVTQDPHQSAYFVIVIVGVCVSLLASVFIIVVYLSYKDLQTITFRLIFYMALADVFNGVTYLLPSEGVSCYVQAVGNTIFPLSSVLWSSVIAYCLHRIVINQDYDLSSEKKFLIYAYGLPFLALIPPAATGTFGYAQGWCWIRAEGDSYVVGSFLRLFCFYVPLWCVIVYNLSVYGRVIRQLNTELEHMSADFYIRKALMRRLMAYPIILIICYSVVTIKRIEDVVNPNEHNLALTLTAWIFQCMIGLLNALVYGYSEAVKERLCRCDKKERSYSNYSDDVLDLARRHSVSITNS